MVSMKDIATACNVSVATVSKALNDYSDISEEKKKEIKEKALELGYFPNSAAIALKTNRTYNIGILFIDEAHNGLTNEYFAKVLQSVKDGAEQGGYDVTFISNKVGKRAMTYLEHCKYRGVDGVVIACIDFDDPEVIELVNSDIPVVTIDHIFNNTMSVISDNVKGVKDLVNYVYGEGHRKIAFVRGADDSSVTRERVTSFYRTAFELGLDVPEKYVLGCDYRDTETAGELTALLLDMQDPPTCIMYPDDFTAIGGINEIRSRGLRIPEDISIVGYDGISYVEVLEPPLTTLAQDCEKLGSIAATKLIELIEKPKTTVIERIVVQGEVLVGKSVKKLH